MEPGDRKTPVAAHDGVFLALRLVGGIADDEPRRLTAAVGRGVVGTPAGNDADDALLAFGCRDINPPVLALVELGDQLLARGQYDATEFVVDVASEIEFIVWVREGEITFYSARIGFEA